MKIRLSHHLVPVALAATLLAAPPTLAQQGHDDDGHSHGEVARPKSFGEAVRRIGDAVRDMEAAIAAGTLDGVSNQANAMAELASELGALSLAKDSGVPRDKVRDTNLAGKDLAAAANELHLAADAGDLVKSRELFARVSEAFGKLDAAAPATYFCPMHCEGSKTYAAPGECPVCHMKLKKLTSEKFSVEVKPVGGVIQAGKPATLLFTLKDPMGQQVKDVEIVHEMPLHLLMVSKDLSWYAHEHPELQPDGTFTLRWTFPAGGEYTLFHDFTPEDVGMQVVPVTLHVEGAAPASVPLTPDADEPKTVDGYAVTLDTGGPVTTGGATHMAYTITKDGQPVTDLQPYLGAMGHLVIISKDLHNFVHSHPHEEGPDHEAGEAHSGDNDDGHGHEGEMDAHAPAAAIRKGGPRVDFEAHFDKPGMYKGWAQFQHQGKILTVPFTFNVTKSEDSPSEHGHGAGEGHGHP